MSEPLREVNRGVAECSVCVSDAARGRGAGERLLGVLLEHRSASI